MNIYRFKSLFLFLLLISLFSCESNTNTGPCEYTQEKFNMIIIDILADEENPSKQIVLVDFDGNVHYADKTHSLEEIRNVKTTTAFVEKNNLKVGNIYKGVLHQKVENSGNCENEIVQWENSFKN